jgi:hypothetical protein
MNRTLLVSIHGWIAALLVAVLVALSFAMPAQTVGMSAGSRTFLLASGWVTLAAFLAAYGYVLRKYAHKLGYSPEFRMRMPRAAIERAEGRIEEIRYAMALGTLTGADEILEKARRVLREEKCQRVLRVHLEGQGNATALVTSRTEPLGRMVRWMHAHVYYGFAAGILTLVHGGARFHSAMGIALNGLTMLVVVTGVVGLVLWLYGPAWLTRLEHDLTTEEVFVLSRHYERRVANALSGIQAQDPTFATALRDATDDAVPVLRAQLSNLMQESGAAETDADMRARDIMALCGQRLRLRAELARLSRARFAMNAWRLIHIPASIVLLAVIIVHVASVWLY